MVKSLAPKNKKKCVDATQARFSKVRRSKLDDLFLEVLAQSEPEPVFHLQMTMCSFFPSAVERRAIKPSSGAERRDAGCVVAILLHAGCDERRRPVRAGIPMQQQTRIGGRGANGKRKSRKRWRLAIAAALATGTAATTKTNRGNAQERQGLQVVLSLRLPPN